MRWHTRVVAGLTADTEPCVSVHFDTSHYLFNCGEGTTRAFIQQKYGIKRSKAIFLTQTKVARAGGLPGMLMSLADSGVKNVEVYGPPGLNHFLATMRPYTFRDPMFVKFVETPQTGSFEKVFEDEFIRVFAFPMIPSPPQSDSESQPTVPSKRRSSNSSLRPDSPKRVTRDNVNNAGKRSSHEPRDPSFDWQHPSFNPSSLSGKQADEWRSIIIRDMFPGFPEPGTANESSAAGRGKPKGQRARRSQQPLPKYDGPRSISTVYLVLGPEIRGKFDPVAADALGVPKRDRGKLTKGESVTVTVDGVQRVVTPNMCMGQSETATAIDCPGLDYIPVLPDLTALEAIREVSPFVLGSVVHRVGPEVLSNPQYALWAKGIGTSECSHQVAGEDFSLNSVTFESSAYLSLTLSELDKDMFFVPQESPPEIELSQVQGLPKNTHVLVANQVTEMSPPKLPTIKAVPGNHPDLYQNALSTHRKGRSLLTTEDQRNSFAKAREEVARLKPSHGKSPTPGGDFRITTLGTGSALPSKYRNVISTIVQMPEYGSIMLDCGENTWGQLCRRFGTDYRRAESAQSVLADLRCIFISHVHGDHHMGLAKLLTQRRSLKATPKHPLYLVLNRVTELCVREYHELEDLGLDDENGVRIVQIQDADNKSRRYSREDSRPRSIKLDELDGLLGFKSMEAVTVRHRTPACFGLVARHESGWGFAYSGDTMPCDALVEAGKDIPLLIHEASMADEEIEKAQEKGHSTIGQAIDVGKRMNAKYVLLTHFSQRYPKMPVVKSGLTATALAFDYMTISTSEIWKFGCYVGALEQVFEANNYDEDDDVME
ncbi:beta-lactamase superfamily protein [Ceratobasidium sp. AG-Ba]|nr:beta-lactamase superfamily protein [Ceratobasidium sp. AG-Ba]QRW10645.1 beta-lactamase superfamily protein [Ceratobasidium sp. AG-Ba]